MIRLFYYSQYLFWPFFALTVFYIIKGSVFEPNLNDVSLGVLFMGIAFGFSSMGDVSDISKREEKLFLDEKKFKSQVIYIAACGIMTVFMTLFFMSLKWFGTNESADAYYNLGLNCSPLILAMFFTLKQFLDKKAYFDIKRQEDLQLENQCVDS
ncbi:hypothetical protein [Marinifilum flexuosum]|uniref:hypothetical protein n=1 Tax=Marinifilum flexuosum TaxID=1117708 RepID=UPI0024933D0B|nr:hypothetical protein [Marinifilum flexuosum]